MFNRIDVRVLFVLLWGLQNVACNPFINGISQAQGLSSITAVPSSVPADGLARATLNIVVRKTDGTSVQDVNVVLASSGPTAILVQPSATDANGVATGYISSTHVGAQIITAAIVDGNTRTPFQMPATVQFTDPNQVPATQILTLTPSATSAVADGAQTLSYTLLVTDLSGVPRVGQAVIVTSSGSNNNLAPSAGQTDAMGAFAFVQTSTSAELKTIVAAVGDDHTSVQVSFVPGPLSNVGSTLTLLPDALMGDGVSQTTVVAIAADAFGNGIAHVPVTLRDSDSADVVSANASTSDATGRVSATITSTTLGQKFVSATMGSFTLTQPLDVVALAPSALTSTLVVGPGTVVADGASTSTITVTAKTPAGVIIPNQRVSLSVTGTTNALSPTQGFTDNRGVFTASLTSTKAETKSIVATLGQTSITGSATFVSGAPSHNTTTLLITPNQVVADGNVKASITVTARDVSGNLSPAETVSLMVTGTSNTLSILGGKTNAQGQLTATLASTHAEVKTVTAILRSASVSAQVNFTANAASFNGSSLTASPNVVVADGNSTTTLTVKLLDTQLNPVAGQAVTLSSTGSGNLFGSSQGTTDSTGVYVTTLASTVAELKQVTAQLGSLQVVLPVTFVPGVPDATRSTLVANPNTVAADGNSVSTLTVVARDAAGNLINNQAVALSVTGGNYTLSPAQGYTNASGVFMGGLRASTSGTRTVVAQLGPVYLVQSVNFVPTAASNITSSFSASPSPVTADGASQTTVTLVARDVLNNPLANANVTLSASGQANTFAQASGKTDASGTYATTLTSTHAELKQLTATIGATSLNTNVTFVAGPPSSAHSSLVPTPASVIADTTHLASLRLTVRDMFDNPIAGQTASLSASGSSNTLAQSVSQTDANGVVNATLASSVAESKTITASFSGSTTNTTVTFVAGPPSAAMSQWTASPNSVIADGATSTTLRLLLEDAYGNVVPSTSVAFGASGTANSFGALSAVTDNAGQAQTTLTSTHAETKQVTAAAGGITLNVPVAFVAGSATSAQTTLSASPNSLVADGAAQTILRLVVRDAQGNPVGGQAVAMSVSGTGNSASTPAAATDANGVLSMTLSSTVAETKTVTASFNGTGVNQSVVFVAGPPVAANSSVTASPNSVVADGAAQATLSVTVQDAFHNLVGNQNVSLAISGTGNTPAAAAGTTNASGIYTRTLSATIAETKTVTATLGASGAPQVQTTVVFVPGATSSSTSTLSVSPNTTVAGTSSLVSFIARDAQSNRVPNQATTLSSNQGQDSFDVPTGSADASGQFSAHVSTTLAGTRTLTATAGGGSAAASWTVTAASPNSSMTTLTSNANTVTADGASAAGLTLTVRDAYGNPVGAQAVNFSISGSHNTLSGASATTSAAGVVTASLRSTTAETKTITATAGTASASVVVTFAPGSANAAASLLVASPNVVVANNSNTTTIVLLARDAQGNVEPYASVALSASGTSNTFQQATGTADANGRYSTTLVSSRAETKLVTASFGGTSLQTNVIFVAGPPASATSSVSVNPNVQVADNSSTTTVSIVVADAFGNPVGNVSTGLVSSGTANTFGATPLVTDSTGAASTTWRSGVAQAKTLTATLGSGGPTVSTAMSFVPGAVSAATSRFVINPNSVVADGATSMNLVVTAQDTQGNAVANQNVTLSANGNTNLFGALSGQTDSTGTFATTLASTRAQAENVQAQLASLSFSQPASFYAGPATQANFILSTPSANVLADGASTASLTLTAQDSFGNPVANQAITLSSSGSANTFTPASGTTNAAGRFTATLSSTHAELKTITASSGALSSQVAVTFVAGNANQSASSFVVNPNTAVADGVGTVSCLVTVRDSTGNPVSGQSVMLSSNGTSNTFAPPGGATDANGQFTATLSSTKAQLKTLSAAFASASLSAQATFVAGSPNTTTTVLSASPNVVTADGSSTSTLSVVVRDAYNNRVPNQSVSFSSTGASNSFAPAATALTDSTGTASVAMASTVAENKTVTVVAGVASASAAVRFVPGAPSHIGWTASPNVVVANNSNTALLDFSVADSAGNPIPNANVTFSATGSSNTLSLMSGATDATGHLTLTLASAVAESKSVTATLVSSGAQYTLSVTFVPGPVSQTHSSFVANPNVITADGSSSTTLTFIAADANDNEINAQTVSLTSTGSSNVFGAMSGSTGADGRYSTTLKSTQAEAKTVSLQTAGLTFNVNVTFVAGSAVSATSTLVSSPNQLVADGVATSSLTFVLRDAQGNVVPNQAATLSTTGTANTLSPTSASTDAQGQIIATLKSTRAETKMITVTVGAVSLQTSVVFVPGPPVSATSSIAASPPTQVADGTSTTALSVVVADAYNNPINNLTLTLASTGSGNTFGASSLSTNASGTASTTLRSSVAEAKTVTATLGTSGAPTVSTAVTFVAGSVDAGQSRFVVDPNNVVADGSTSMGLVVFAKDAQGNPVANQNVTFSASGSSNVFAAFAGATDANGRLATTLTSTKAQSESLTAQLASLNLTQPATFYAGPATQANFTLASSATSVMADGNTTTTLTVSVQDAFGNPIAGRAINLSSTGSHNLFISASGTTNAAGLFTATLSSTQAETKTITASSGVLSASVVVPYVAGAANQAHSSFVVNPNAQVADGMASIACVVTVRDAQDNPVQNQNVALSSTGSNNTFGQLSGMTDPNGQFTTTLASTKAQTKSLTANLGTSSLSASATFYAGSPNATTSSLYASPTTTTADGNATITLSGTVRDAFGNPINNQTVSFSSTGSNNTFVPVTTSTDASGNISSVMTSISAGSKTVTMSAGVASVSVPVTFTAGAANNVTWVASPNNVVANGTATTTLTLTLKDNNNNPLSGVATSFSVSGSGNNPNGATGTTDASGVVSWTLASTVAQQKTLTATLTSSGAQYTTQTTFVPGPVDAIRSSLTANPTQVTADGSSSSTLSLIAQDANGNLVPGAAVTVSASGAGAHLGATTGTTASDGSFSTTLTSSVAENKTVTVVAGGVTFTVAVNFVPGAATQTQSSFVASPNSVVADGVASTTLTLILRDAQNNLATNVAVNVATSGSANTLTHASGTTNASGQFTSTLQSTKAELKTLTASFAGTSLQVGVTFVAGSPNSTYTTLLANPNSQVADGSSTTALTATVEDVFGNLVQGQNVVFTASGTSNTFGQTTVQTNASGVATTTLRSTKAQIETLTATAASAVANANMVFVAGGVSSTNSSFTLSPNQAVANGSASMTLVVTAKDAQNNPIANQAVSISGSGSANSFGAVSGTTNAAGVFSTTLSSTLAQSEVLTAQAGPASYTQTATFVAGPATQANFTLAASQTSVVADGNATTSLTLTAQDAFGNPVANQNVTFTSTGSNNTFTPGSGLTNAAGQLVVAFTSTHAEAKTVTATSGALSAQTVITFIPGAVSQSASSFVTNPNQVVADGQATTLCTVTLNDASGNPISNQTVNLSSSGGNNVFVVASGQTNASGQYTATLASTRAQLKTLTADLGTTSLTSTVNFVAGSPNATTTTLAASPTSTTADGTSTITLTGVVRDAFGNRVANQSVSLSSSGTGNSFSNTALTTDATGTVTATLTSTKAEAKTITLVAGPATVTTVATFVAGAPSQVAFVANPNALTANGNATSALTLTITDSSNNPIVNANVGFTVSGTGNTLSPMAAATNASGVINLTLNSSVAETKTVTATLASNNAQYSVQVIFVPGPIDQVQSSLTASPNSVTADGTATSQLTFTAADANGNLVPGAAVSIAASGTGNTLAQASGSTTSAGLFQTTLASTVTGTKTVTVTAGGKTFSVNVAFVAGGAQANKCSFVASPNSLVANGSAASSLTLIVRDAQSNVIASMPVSFTVSGTSNTLTPAGSMTDASGQLTATLVSTSAEQKTVTATFGGTQIQTTVTFVAGSPNNVYSSLIANPNSQVADGSTTSALTITIADAFGNPVGAQGVSLAASGSSNIFGSTTLTTNASGVASTTLASALAQVETLVATAGPANANATMTFVAGAASSGNMTLTASPNSLVADGTTPSSLSVTVRDAHNNPVPNQAVTLSSTGSGHTFAQTSGTTNASGVFTTTLVSTVAQTKTITAAAGAASTTTTVTFVPGPPANAQSSLTASPNSVTADGSSKSNLSVVVRDAQGNPIPNQTVSLSSTGASNTFVPSTGTTDSTGALSATLASTVAESKTVTASFGAAQATSTVVFVPGGPSSSTSTFVASPNTLVADNTATTTMTVTLRDAQGNLIGNQSVTFATSGTGNTLSAASATTNASGVASVTLKSTVAETKTLTATASGTPLTTSVLFVAGAPYPAYCSLSANPNQVTADGSSTATLTAQLQDAYHNVVGNQNVTFSSTGAPTTLTPQVASTNASGSATATLASTLAGSKTVTASFSGGSVTTAVTFVSGAVSATNSSIVASPNSVVADGSSTVPITVTVRDAQSNPIANQTVTFTGSGSNNTFVLSGATNSSGVMTATLASTLAQTETVTANIGGSTISTGVQFVPGAAVAANSNFTTSLSSVVANGSTTTTLTLTLRDAQNNLVSPTNAVFTSTGSGNTFTPGNGNTTSGTLTTTLASTVAESKTVTATFAGGQTLSVVVSFVPGAVSVAQSSFTASPNALVANGTATTTLTTTLKDAQGNLIANQSVSYTSSGSANTFAQASGTTNASGVFTTTLTSTKAETKTITSAFASTSLTASVTFVPGAPYLATSSLVASPNQVTTDGNSTSSLVTTIRDAQSNNISSQSVTLSTTGTSNIFTPGSGTTSNGLFNATVSSTVAQSEVVTATAGAIAPNANVIFVTGAPSSSLSTLTGSPNSLVANGTAQSTLTLTVRDSQNNLISNQSVSFAITGGAATPSATTATTNASGVATITLTSTVSGTKTVTASFGGASASTTVTFVPGPPVAATSSLTASPNSLVADGTTTATITLVARDANSNVIPSLAVTFAASGTNNTVFTASGTTSASGVSTTSLASTLVQTQNVTATFGGASLSVPVSFVPGAPASASSSIVDTPNSVVADGVSTSSLVVTVRDAQNNLVPNSAVALSATGVLTTFANPNGTTNASGQYTTTVTSTKAQTETLRATLGSSGTPPNVATSITFVPGAPVAATSSFVLNPNTATADGNSTMALTVTVADANGNLITGATVYLSGSGTNNTFGALSGPTNSSGVFTTTLASSTAQVETLTASLGSSGAGAPKLTQTATFTAGAASAVTSSVAGNPNVVTADNTQVSVLTATILDATGNPVSGQSVAFSSSGTGNTLSAANANTNSLGQAQVNLTSTKAESKTITATFNGSSVTNTVLFKAGAPVTANSSIVINPNTGVIADGVATTSISVTVRDTYNNLVLNTPVGLTSTGTANTFTAANGNTNASTGIYTTSLASTVAQTKTVTATAGAASVATTVTFVAGPPAAGLSSFTVNPNTGILANGIATTTLTATIKDARGNVVPNILVSFTSTGTNTSYGARTTWTNSSGVAKTVASSTTVGTKTLTIQTGGAALNANASFIRQAAACGSTLLLPTLPEPASTGSQPSALAMADFNGDGFLDIAVANSNDTTVSVYLGLGTGVMGAPVNYAAGNKPSSLAIADFNDDGNYDLLLSNTASGTVSVLLGNASGGFASNVAYSANYNPQSAIAVDVNNDGRQDIVAANNANGTLSILIGKGDGSFAQPSTVLAGVNPTYISAGDLNADGFVDLLVTNTSAASVLVLLGAGNGSFSSNANVVADAGAFATALIDLNQDGILDLLTSSQTVSSIRYNFGSGNGNFVYQNALNAAGGVYSIAAADINGDGYVDIVGGVSQPSDRSYYNLNIFYGGIGNAYSSSLASPTGQRPTGVALGDLNRDGYLEIVTANTAANTLSVFLGQASKAAKIASVSDYSSGSALSAVRQVVSVDLDLDGNPDIVGATNGNSIFTALIPNTGVVGSANFYATTTGSVVNALAINDFNLDGQPDVVTANGATNDFSMLLGKPSGTFAAAVPYTMDSNTLAIGAVDFNNDGRVDVVTANSTAATAAIRLGNGDGTFGAATTTSAPTGARNLAIADLNGDGNQDILIGGTVSGAAIVALLGKGDGTFNGQPAWVPAGVMSSLALGDFDGDGKVDLAAANLIGGNVVTALGAGNGNFTTTATIAVNGPNIVSVTDINLDGRQDLLVTNSVSSTVSIAIGGGDGTFAPFQSYLGMQGAYGAAVADFNADGMMDICSAGTGFSGLTLLPGSGCSSLTPGPKGPYTLSLSASPNSLVANGNTTTTLTASLKDPNGNANPNQVVTFIITGSNNAVSRVTGITNSAGVFTTTVTSTKAETKTARVQGYVPESPQASTSLTFVPGPVAAMYTTLVANPNNNVVANNVATTTLTVLAEDANGNPIVGQAVTFTSSASSTTSFAQASGVTNSSGMYSTTVMSTTSGTQTLSATMN